MGDVVLTQSHPVEGHAPSLLPPGSWSLVWNDEFDGDRLDETKWSFRTWFWGRKAHWFATAEDGAVELADSVCHLKLVRRKDGQFVSPQLQTGSLIWDLPRSEGGGRFGFWPLPEREKPKFLHRFGYYECRCRLQQMGDWWSAFWMQSPMQGCSLDPRRAGVEHDIMESFEPGLVAPSAYHTNGYGAEYFGWTSPPRPAGMAIGDFNRKFGIYVDKTEFHNFGFLWEKDGYTTFIDGVQRGPKVGCGSGEAVSEVEQFILISTEAKDFRSGGMTGPAAPGLSAALAAGDEFLVDFVRVFDPA